jgi:homocitrate synthase
MCPTDGANGTNGTPSAPIPPSRTNPYQAVSDFISNVGRFKIIESTLREGEQFANAYFDTGTLPSPLATFEPLAYYD